MPRLGSGTIAGVLKIPMCIGSAVSFFFHAKRHPREMGERDITAFLTYLAVEKNVAASKQNQALNALLFLYLNALLILSVSAR